MWRWSVERDHYSGCLFRVLLTLNGSSAMLRCTWDSSGNPALKEGLLPMPARGFSSSGTITNVKQVKWLVEWLEQIVHHLFPVADTTEYSRRFQWGTADSVLSHAQK